MCRLVKSGLISSMKYTNPPQGSRDPTRRGRNHRLQNSGLGAIPRLKVHLVSIPVGVNSKDEIEMPDTLRLT